MPFLAVIEGKRIEQKQSRGLKLWIFPKDKEDRVFNLKSKLSKSIYNTLVNVPALDRQLLKSFPHLHDVQFSHKKGPTDLNLGVQYSHSHAEEDVLEGLSF